MRQEWAVTAAEHQAAKLRAIRRGNGDDADAEQVYRWALYAIGTIPRNRTDDVVDATIGRGIPVTQALDEIGA